MNPDRSELPELIERLRQRYPQWRLGQLIANLADWADCSVWDIEDEELIQAAQNHLDGIAEKAAATKS